MWEDEYFEFHGKYLDFPRRMVTPKPVQDPHPPCWMAATSDGSAAVAGKLGLGLLSFSILQPLEGMAKQIAQYRDAAGEPEPITRVTTNKVAAYTLVHCADSMAQCEANGIWESVWWWYKNLAEFTLEWEFPNFPEAERDRIFPLLKRQLEGNFEPQDFNDADMIIVGDPEQCLAKMLHYAELGVDQLICYVQFGHLPHEAVMRTIELLGTEVIPELERAVGGRRRTGWRRRDPYRRHAGPRLSRTAPSRRPPLRRDRRRPGDRPPGGARARVGRARGCRASTSTPTWPPTSRTRSAASPWSATPSTGRTSERLFADARARARWHRRRRRHHRHGAVLDAHRH